MVMVKMPCGLTWYEDKKFLLNLNIYLDAMKSNDDLVIVVDGQERAGKSLRMRQIGKYCSNYLGTSFDNNNIHQDLQKYIDFSINNRDTHGTVCILDESRNQLNRKSTMSKINKRFTNFMSECGKYNHVHIIALPAYHDLDKYIILWRMKFLVHIHKWFEKDETKTSGYKLARGGYTLYMNDKYLGDCYRYPYAYPRRWEGKGTFNNIEVLTKKELQLYDKEKDSNIHLRYHSESEQEELGKLEKTWKFRFVNLAEAVKNETSLKNDSIAAFSQMNAKTLSNTLSQAQDMVTSYIITKK